MTEQWLLIWVERPIRAFAGAMSNRLGLRRSRPGSQTHNSAFGVPTPCLPWVRATTGGAPTAVLRTAAT